jgi:ABC-type glycerol-3-phosphate transport system substrate-binding protein
VNIYGPSLSILPSTPEKELAAWLLIKHLASPAAQARWAAASQYLPVHPGAADSLTDLFAEFPAYQSAYLLLPYAQFEPSLPGYEDVRGLVAEALVDIARGADVETTLALLNAQANTILGDQGK